MQYKWIVIFFPLLILLGCSKKSYIELPIQESYDYNMIRYKLPDTYTVEYDIPFDWHLIHKGHATARGEMGSAQSVKLEIFPAFHKGSDMPIYVKPDMDSDIRILGLFYKELVYKKQIEFKNLQCYEYQRKAFSQPISSSIKDGYGRPGMYRLRTKILCPFKYEDGKYYRLTIEYGAANHASKKWIDEGKKIPNIYETFSDIEKDAKWVMETLKFQGEIEAVVPNKEVKKRMEINKHRSECKWFCIKRHQLRPEFWEEKYGLGIEPKCNQTCEEIDFRKGNWKIDINTGIDQSTPVVQK